MKAAAKIPLHCPSTFHHALLLLPREAAARHCSSLWVLDCVQFMLAGSWRSASGQVRQTRPHDGRHRRAAAGRRLIAGKL